MTTDPLHLLDELDAAHAAGTQGPWELDPVGLFASNDTGDLLFDYRDVVLVQDHPDGVKQCTADGELIVAAVNALPQLTAALRAVLERHVPWWEVNGVRLDNTVTVGCDQHTCDGDEDRECAQNDGDGHEVLACNECRCVIDYDLEGFRLWPCPTVRAITDALTPQETPRG